MGKATQGTRVIAVETCLAPARKRAFSLQCEFAQQFRRYCSGRKKEANDDRRKRKATNRDIQEHVIWVSTWFFAYFAD